MCLVCLTTFYEGVLMFYYIPNGLLCFDNVVRFPLLGFRLRLGDSMLAFMYAKGRNCRSGVIIVPRYICIYICAYIYIYVYTCIHTHLHTYNSIFTYMRRSFVGASRGMKRRIRCKTRLHIKTLNVLYAFPMGASVSITCRHALHWVQVISSGLSSNGTIIAISGVSGLQLLRGFMMTYQFVSIAR